MLAMNVRMILISTPLTRRDCLSQQRCIRTVETRLLNSLPQRSRFQVFFYTNELTNQPEVVSVSDELLFHWFEERPCSLRRLIPFRIVNFKLGWTRTLNY